MRCDAVRCGAVRYDARGVAIRTDGSKKKVEFAMFVTKPLDPGESSVGDNMPIWI